MSKIQIIITVWTQSAFRVILVRIFPHSDWIRRDTVRMWGNTDKNNSEYYSQRCNYDSWARGSGEKNGPKHSLVRKLVLLLFGDGLLNFNSLFQKAIRLCALRSLGSRLFYLITVDRIFFFFFKVMFRRKYSNFICISGIVIRISC